MIHIGRIWCNVTYRTCIPYLVLLAGIHNGRDNICRVIRIQRYATSLLVFGVHGSVRRDRLSNRQKHCWDFFEIELSRISDKILFKANLLTVINRNNLSINMDFVRLLVDYDIRFTLLSKLVFKPVGTGCERCLISCDINSLVLCLICDFYVDTVWILTSMTFRNLEHSGSIGFRNILWRFKRSAIAFRIGSHLPVMCIDDKLSTNCWRRILIEFTSSEHFFLPFSVLVEVIGANILGIGIEISTEICPLKPTKTTLAGNLI